jgi:hypothetical protein
MNLLKGFPFSFQKRAGLQRRARPRFLPSKWESRGSLHLDITTDKIFLTNCKKVCQVENPSSPPFCLSMTGKGLPKGGTVPLFDYLFPAV